MSNDILQRLERVIENQTGPETDAFLFEIRSHGIVELQQSPLCSACRSILEHTNSPLSPSLQWLLTRIQNAGLYPTYSCYLGLELLTSQIDTFTESSEITRYAFRLIYDLLTYLLEIQEFKDYPERAQLERQIKTLHDKSRAVIFAKELIPLSSAEVVRFSLLPESHVKEELVFQRVIQCAEIVFFAMNKLVDKAVESVVYGDILHTIVALHWIRCLEEILLPLFRPLVVMKNEDWLAFRPYLDTPSAIQSSAFHSICVKLALLKRTYRHPRVPKEQQRYQALCEEMIEACLGDLNLWYNAHTKIATKYGRDDTGQKSEGVRWLEGQSIIESLLL